jgi:hypothetical protein
VKSLRIVLDVEIIREAPDKLVELRKHLKSAVADTGRGAEVQFLLRLAGGDTEIEIALPRMKFSMTPILIGELSTLPGIISVVEQ